jgi:hypothetical protein
MGNEDSIMEDHRKHLCKQQRMEQEHIKNRIKQTTTAFLTAIIVTLIILNTGSRNKAPQHGQCAQKQDNKDKKEDNRSLGNEGYRTEEHHKRASTTNTRSRRPVTTWTAPSTATQN